MTPVVAVIAPGMMGAGVGRRLTDNGVKVLTSLTGRSPETLRRASAAGMMPASDEEIAASDFILSILPPGDAVALAQRLVPTLTSPPRWRRPARHSSMSASSGARRSQAMPGRASMRRAHMRSASPRSSLTGSTSACWKARSPRPRR
jgi:hypothetical protein